MKKTDIAMIIFIASLTMMISYFVTQSLMGDATSKPVTVKIADPISSDVKQPSERIFNREAINPTVEVTIGNEAPQPVSPTGQ